MVTTMQNLNEIVLKVGAEIYFQNKKFLIKAILNFEELLLLDIDKNEKKIINISQLSYKPKIAIENISFDHDIQRVSDDHWAKALKKYEVIKRMTLPKF